MANVQLDTEQPQSVVKTLIQKNQPAPIVEAVKETPKIEESPVIVSDDKIEESLVTEELAEEMNLPKGLIGRPLKEVGKSYRESLRWGNDNNQKLIDLETNFRQLEGKISQAEMKSAETAANKETENQLGKAPDPVEDPEGFNKWLDKRDEVIVKRLEKMFEAKAKEISTSVNDNPAIKQAQELAAEQTVKLTTQKLQAFLPDNIDASKLLDAWFEAKEKIIPDILKSNLYVNHQDEFVQDVIDWYKAQSFDSLKSEKESDLIKKIHKKTKENLEKLGKTVNENIVSKKTLEEGKPESTAGRLVTQLQRTRKLSAG